MKTFKLSDFSEIEKIGPASAFLQRSADPQGPLAILYDQNPNDCYHSFDTKSPNTEAQCGPRCLLELYTQCTRFLSSLTPAVVCNSPIGALLIEELRRTNCFALFSLGAALTLTSEFSLRLRHASLLQCYTRVLKMLLKSRLLIFDEVNY